MTPSVQSVLEFWFSTALATPSAAAQRNRIWFGADEDFDQQIAQRFADLPDRAARGDWPNAVDSPDQALACVLVLDQFPRNLFRGGQARAFAYDEAARAQTRAALARGFDERVGPVEAAFFYLPLEHSEDVTDQRECVGLFERLVARAPEGWRPLCESYLTYAQRHCKIIERFGRFPHRNEALGRAPTAAETAYLESGGDTFGA